MTISFGEITERQREYHREWLLREEREWPNKFRAMLFSDEPVNPILSNRFYEAMEAADRVEARQLKFDF